MTDCLEKLAGLGSAAILTPPLRSEATVCANGGRLGSDLFEWLFHKNGFYAFESALHIFPIGTKAGVNDLKTWNSPDLWRGAYRDLTDHCLFFGEDVFGNQFCLKDNSVGSFDAETGTVTWLGRSLQEWARILLSDYELHTGYRLAHDWQSKNRALDVGERLAPKMPFVTGGEYTVQNLYAIEAAKGMRFRGDLATQIRDLPDGTPIHYQVG